MFNKRLNWKLFGRFFAVFMMTAPIILACYFAGSYYLFRDSFSRFVYTKDYMASREKLEQLRYYYQKTENLPVISWVANKTVFREFYKFEAAQKYLEGNFNEIWHKYNHVDDYFLNFLVGNSIWRIGQAQYADALKTKNKVKRNDKLKKIEERIMGAKSNYETAIMHYPYGEIPWSYRHNYDQTLDDVARKRGLEPGRGKKGSHEKGDLGPLSPDNDQDGKKDSGGGKDPERTG